MSIRLLFITALCISHGAFSMERLLQNMPQEELDLSLFLVAQEGDLPELQVLIDHGARINSQESIADLNEQRDTPLMVAAREGHTHVVSFLINEGAWMDVQNASGLTALHHAVAGNHVRIAEIFIAFGGDIFARAVDGTPIEYAARSGTQEMLDLLLTGISEEDEENIGDTRELLLCMNRMCIQKDGAGGKKLAFAKLRAGHQSRAPDERLKNVRALVAKHLVHNLVDERMQRIAEFLAPSDPAYETIRARIESNVKRILFGDPVPKRLPEVTREIDDPYGSWFVGPRD